MLQKECEQLDKAIGNINTGLEEVYCILDKILSEPEKDYDLTFKKEVFNLYTPFTKDEKKDVENKRRTYIKLILEYVLKKRIKSLKGDIDYFPKDIFEIWYAFSYGADPEDHKVEILNLKEVFKEGDEEFGTSRPLDKESYQVRLQDVKIVKEEDFLKE